jgi:hypothetical protein
LSSFSVLKSLKVSLKIAGEMIVPDCDASTGDVAEIFSDYVHKIGSFILEMNFSGTSHGVSMKEKFNPNTASCGDLNPTEFAISTSPSL